MPSAWRSAVSKGARSIVNRSCPFLTKSPSLKCTRTSSPEICGLMLTVEIASTFPMACNCTGMLRVATVETLTGAAGACCSLAACTASRPEQPRLGRRSGSAQIKNSNRFILSFFPLGEQDGGRGRSTRCGPDGLAQTAFRPARWLPELPQLLQHRTSGTSRLQRVPAPESDRQSCPEIRAQQAAGSSYEMLPGESADGYGPPKLRSTPQHRCEKSAPTTCDFPVR